MVSSQQNLEAIVDSLQTFSLRVYTPGFEINCTYSVFL